MFSPIQLIPGMDQGTQASAINNNFRQIESENRSKTILNSNGVPQLTIGMYGDSNYGIVGYDLDGTRRILIGSSPSDGRIGIWVSKPGIDVIEALGG